jgi:SAM-dependent methyltransferase
MDYTEPVDDLIARFKEHPVDLLGIGAGEQEYAYLQELKHSYVRTLNDVDGFMKKNTHILEIGSLFGIVSLALKQSGYRITGCDIPEFQQSQNLRKIYAQQEIPFDAVNLRQYKLPYTDESFDAVIACEVLEHLNFNPLPVFQEINRVLKKGGILYLAMPNQACIDNRIKLLMGRSIHEPVSYFFGQLDKRENKIVSLHWREYTMRETLEMMDKMGFSVIRNYYSKENGPAGPGLVSFAKRIFHLIPSLRTSLVVIGKKREITPEYSFTFTAANR